MPKPAALGTHVIAKAGDDDDGGWCLGVVAAVRAAGRLDMQYDHGDEEQRKAPARVRRLFRRPTRPSMAIFFGSRASRRAAERALYDVP